MGKTGLFPRLFRSERVQENPVNLPIKGVVDCLQPQLEDRKELAMLRKNKSLTSFVAGLLASAMAVPPVAAQSYETWYPAANNDYYGDTPEGEMARERAAQNWRSQYQSVSPAEPYTSQASQDYYAQKNQGYYAETDPSYVEEDYDAPGYYASDDYYSASDHYAYHRECERQKEKDQVGGLVFGMIVGGLFGNAVSNRRNRGSATALGAIMGSALGASLASDMDCDDHYYLYQTSYDGFERGYSTSSYQWRNPNTGHHGDFWVGDYYRGPIGQRCATFSQTIWIQGRPEKARGYACRRGDGSWEIIK
jgi:surface antigen